jgi:23S rRNA (uracil1939-C5)-methyltransferase
MKKTEPMPSIQIEKMVFGGLGLGHTALQTVFVSDVLAGETVKPGIIQKRAGCLFAAPEHIINPSPDRLKPFCPFATAGPQRCGGCDWQHIRYDRQVSLKREIFLECLSRIGKIKTMPGIEVFSSPEKNYRHRARFQIDYAKKHIGFFRRDSNRVVDIDQCPLLTDSLNDFLKNMRSALQTIPEGCTQINAIAGASGIVASSPIIPSLSENHTEIKTAGLNFRVAGNSFFQQNVFLLDALGSWAADKIGGTRCVDLYGGVGFFSMFLGRQFAQGLLIEESESQVQLARENFQSNNVENVEATACRVENFFAGKNQPLLPDDCVIVDPPRTGLPDMVRKYLGKASPALIVYISCNPSTQARDLNHLVNSCGYKIVHAALFDLYPHTSHMETGIILRKE